jgi:hypothetical protein
MALTEVQQRWIEALESGYYKQGKSRLRDSHDNYCCLGVLCDLAVEAGVIPPPEPSINVYNAYSYLNHTTIVPPAVQLWAGLNNPTGNAKRFELTALNDKGISFSEIAQLIRSEPPGLFVNTSTKPPAA